MRLLASEGSSFLTIPYSYSSYSELLRVGNMFGSGNMAQRSARMLVRKFCVHKQTNMGVKLCISSLDCDREFYRVQIADFLRIDFHNTLAPACKDHACKNKSGCKDKILRVQKVSNEGLL